MAIKKFVKKKKFAQTVRPLSLVYNYNKNTLHKIINEALKILHDLYKKG